MIPFAGPQVRPGAIDAALGFGRPHQTITPVALSQEFPAMVWLSGLKRTFQRLGALDAERPERWPVTGLMAFYGLQAPSTPAPIRDISATGIYLVIQESFEVGQLVTLKLQREGDPELSSELQVNIQAKVSRHERSGVGLGFVLPPGLEQELWEVLIRGVVFFTDPAQLIEVFRTLRTVLFLGRLCQSRAKEAILLLGQHLHQDRVATLCRIARTAENRIAADPDAYRMRAHPTLVANLLRDGSWSCDELTTQLWEGLFVSSCSVDEPDDVNQIFVDMLVHITPRQAVILTYACERVLSAAPASGNSVPGNSIHADSTPGIPTPADSVTSNSTLGNSTPAASTPSDSTPSVSTTIESKIDNPTPADATPAASTPSDSTPGASTTIESKIDNPTLVDSTPANPTPANPIPPPVVLSPDEITKLTGMNDLSRNATDLAYLFNMGLLQNVFDFTSYREFDSFDITPSRLGIELYRHCHGQRSKIDPEMAAAAKEHLAIFFPPPLPSVFENYTPFVPESSEK